MCQEYYNMEEFLLNLSNHQVQDILEELGMIDEDDHCNYTAEELFKAGMEYAIEKAVVFVYHLTAHPNVHNIDGNDLVESFKEYMNTDITKIKE